ncbi:hypothetical protein BF93_17455 [Brachybacterium phenoliresistens]|uniref:Uncharacterized protein n=1 Tax=Brachybacterium phenoliresistens TaxID=396014 RepID=Z9JTM0_9MICO|nr:hypothetical protein BF93_17455 [Brachybacterium phenoliresistens]
MTPVDLDAPRMQRLQLVELLDGDRGMVGELDPSLTGALAADVQTGDDLAAGLDEGAGNGHGLQ